MFYSNVVKLNKLQLWQTQELDSRLKCLRFESAYWLYKYRLQYNTIQI